MRLPPWMWKVIRSRKTRIALACSPFALCALVAAAYPVTDWLGRRAVEGHLAELVAAGHAVEPEAYWSAPERPEDDVFQHPAMKSELADPKVESLRFIKPPIPGMARRPPKREPEFAKGLDVRLWFDPPEPDERVAAERLLGEIEGTLRHLDELKASLDRPVAAWPVARVKNGFTGGREIPQIASPVLRLQRISGVIGEVAMLHLAKGDAPAAAEGVASVLRAASLGLEPKPSLVSVLVADPALQSAQWLIWEGVIRERWTEPMLEEFERQLAGLRPQQAASRCYLGEIAFARSSAELLLERSGDSRTRGELQWREGWKWERERIFARTRALWRGVRPSGVGLMKFVESEGAFLRHASHAAGQPRERFSADDLRFFRERHDGFPEAYFVKAGWYTNGKDADAEGWARLENLAEVALRMEARIALLRTGIALERYRISRGSSPGDLRQLVPDYLSAVPTDPFDDQPLRHRVQADGSPHLWSIGVDLVDEGGLPHLQRNAKGDLVWITRAIPGFTKEELRR